jgi:hypothetical protein
MSDWIRTIVETVLWLGASVAALALFVVLALLERVDAVVEWARTAWLGRPATTRRASPVLH